MSPSTSRSRWTRFAAPSRFDALARRVIPWCSAVAAVAGVAGLVWALVIAPPDATQGQAYRILYVHVPAAWLSMLLYLALAFWACIGWAWKARMASMLARAIAPTGALFTVLSLATGSLWGRPTWGTWWVWDARLTSEFVLLLLYAGFIALTQAIDDRTRADRAAALLALVGVVNVPVIHFSVHWWNTLHQGASITVGAAPRLATGMLVALALTTLACWAYALAVVLARARAEIAEQERHSAWLAGAAPAAPAAAAAAATPREALS